jgi:hypothetical protein
MLASPYYCCTVCWQCAGQFVSNSCRVVTEEEVRRVRQRCLVFVSQAHFTEVMLSGYLPPRFDFQGQGNKLGYLVLIKVVVTDEDKRLAAIGQHRTQRHAFNIVGN